MNIKVSIIIPVYNVEKYLRVCLDSALEQEFDSFEVIAINDGSPDSCADILLEYSEKHKNLKVITQENMGLGGARNTGIKSAKGEYLLFLDSDDALLPNALSFLYKQAQATGADIVTFGMNYVLENNTISFTHKAIESGSKALTPEDYLLVFANDSYTWNKFYKASIFTQNNIEFPNRAWYEDLATIPKIILKSNKIVLTDKVFYNYLQRSDSIMHISNEDRNIEMIYAVEEVLNYYKQHQAFDRYFTTLEYLTVLHILILATNRVVSTNPKHPLLEQFYNYCKTNFPNYNKNARLKDTLPFKRKAIYWLSKNKMYKALFLLNKLNNL